MAAFLQKGFPTVKDNAWRYTDVTAIREAAFVPEGESIQPARLDRPLEGVEVLDIFVAIKTFPELLEKYLGRQAGHEGNPFTALNTGLFRSGTFIRISDGVILKEPIRIVHSASPARKAGAFQRRTIILMGKGSKASIVETYVAGDGQNYFTNAVTEIVLEEGAQMEHCKIQQEAPEAFHIAMTQVAQRRGSSFVSFALSTGARLMRNDCRVALTEEGASCELNGLYLGDKDQVLDHQTFVDHQKPDGKSDQFFKGLLAGNSRGVFRGHVMVRQDAQRTDAHQTNKNLLLSDTAKVDTQPQLEILADDVKCGHGSAIGQLQEDAVFYLRSRGIGEKEAARMLAQGFAREVIERSSLSFMKETLLELVSEKLGKQFNSLNGQWATGNE
ncbi:MAG: Fe-S cluster assembly protein SufD [Omnitrophica bacterium RIFOXYB12_FULL_50_7]|nr:MAG: Fe-S cluster assembly protein SufD [Omnitrophica bacterium RIFOXYB12_FULL_50_7]